MFLPKRPPPPPHACSHGLTPFSRACPRPFASPFTSWLPVFPSFPESAFHAPHPNKIRVDLIPFSPPRSLSLLSSVGYLFPFATFSVRFLGSYLPSLYLFFLPPLFNPLNWPFFEAAYRGNLFFSPPNRFERVLLLSPMRFFFYLSCPPFPHRALPSSQDYKRGHPFLTGD